MPQPGAKAAGIAGILAGAGLLTELVFFLASGWQPDVFADPVAALAFLEERGGYMRAAGLAGSINLVFATIFVAGLAARLERAATAATATLYLGVIGIAVHALVPIGLWLGAPTFGAMAGHGATVVQPAWAAFAAFMAVAGGVGYLFLGLSMLAAGFGGVSTGALPPALAWLTMLGGAATVAIIVAESTPFGVLAQVAFLPSIALSVVFRVWAGVVLMRSGYPAATAGGFASQGHRGYTEPATTSSPASNAPQNRSVVRATTLGALAATVLNVALWGIGRAVNASFLVDPALGAPNLQVGVVKVILTTLLPFALGAALLALAARRSRRRITTLAVAAGVLAVVSAAGPLAGAHDTATGLLLATMHVTTGAAFVGAATRIRGNW